jgi:hypothetical protein
VPDVAPERGEGSGSTRGVSQRLRRQLRVAKGSTELTKLRNIAIDGRRLAGHQQPIVLDNERNLGACLIAVSLVCHQPTS